ncbi:MAG: class I SAM-dependent methyltransferase [Gammaproteobacteria bacterium]|nr:class I SAM-dependent methyltransferase [Gammaproteobacteria bacterium]
MIDKQTIAVYNKQTEEYANLAQNSVVSQELKEFISLIKPGGHVLDLGCGPAMDSAFMRDQGLTVDPVDASTEMVKLANSKFDIGARVARFEDITEIDAYDGIWANYSLLHATADSFPTILAALYRALRPGGWLHIGMKSGTGSQRDRLGRFYTYYTEEDLQAVLTATGFTIGSTKTGSTRGLAGDVEPWIMMDCCTEEPITK